MFLFQSGSYKFSVIWSFVNFVSLTSSFSVQLSNITISNFGLFLFLKRMVNYFIQICVVQSRFKDIFSLLIILTVFPISESSIMLYIIVTEQYLHLKSAKLSKEYSLMINIIELPYFRFYDCLRMSKLYNGDGILYFQASSVKPGKAVFA